MGLPRRLPSTFPFAALLFVSGVTALVFETLWVKQLALVVGVTVHAVTIAVSAFFAGLALGGAVFGPMADRVARPVRLYAALESGIAVSGVLATLALASSAPLFVRLQGVAGPLAWVLPFLLVGVPATLMGGTLPAAVRALGPGDSAVGRVTGLLYAMNTAGAIGGALAVPFVLVPAFGVRGAALFAGLLCLAVAAAALGLDARLARQLAPAVEAHDALPRDARLALALYAVAGGVALGYEVVWSEVLVQFLSTRAHAFAVMLATYLGGLALGSWLFSRVADRTRNPWRLFGLLIAGAGAASLLTVVAIGSWLPDAQVFAGKWAMRATGREGLEMAARFLVAAGAVLLAPTIFLGGAFPVAARLAAGAARPGRGVGAVAAVNTAGGVLGTLLTGFLLVPAFGLVGSLGLLACGGALVGAIALARGASGVGARVTAFAILAAVAGTALLVPRDTLGRLLAERRGGRMVFYEEDTAGTVAVLEQRAAGGTFRRLYIQGVSNSGDVLPSRRYMRLQALVPLLIHKGEPRSALVVGLGTGITAGALLAYPGLETRVVSELLPGVVRAAPLFAGNLGAGADPRLEIRIGDGRHELLRRTDRYDLITLEPPPPSAAGVVNLYSRDFYELCRARLAPGGLMAQWWPLPTQNDEDSRSLVRSFLDAFPYASAWTTELHEMLLVGSMSPIELDASRVTARFSAGAVAASLAEVGVESPAALLGTWVTGREGLERYAAGAPAVTDNRPLIENAAWVRRGEILRVLPRVLGVAGSPPVTGDASLKGQADARQRELFAFYRAALRAYAGDRAGAAEALGETFSGDPGNTYYRWMATGGN
ncbi:MAG: fused MFS/spermidine synthase [Acidobacteria bacterium]|nr:fused MFS/spermidine synthase [Acidobacteriota bacterium]